jgi:DNA-binding NtrC family response regulator
VEEHRFREDLFYRINVLHVHLPPLRERGSDILLLAQHFVSRCAEALGKPVTGLTPEAAERLMVYGWPGNVRELSNCVERAVALTRFDRIVVDDLPEKVRAYRPSRVLLGGEDPAEVLPLEEVERRYILWAVDTIGNRTLAAQRLGLDRKTLYRKLARYDHPKKRDVDHGGKG